MDIEQAETSRVPVLADDSYPRYRWVIIGFLWLIQQSFSLTQFSLGIMLPSIRSDLGISAAQAGWLMAAGYVSQALLSIPAAVFLVRFGPKAILFVAQVAAGVFTLFQALATGFFSFFYARVFFATGNLGVQPAGVLLRLQWVPRRELALVMGMGMGLSSTAQGLGLILTPFLLLAFGSWRPTLAFYAALSLALAGLWLILGRERVTEQYRQAMARSKERSSLRLVGGRKEFWMLGVIMLTINLSWLPIMTFYPTYLIEERGLSLTVAGLITGIGSAGGVVGALGAGVLSDRLGRRKPLIWPVGLTLPLVYATLFLPVPVPLLALLAFLWGVLVWSGAPAIMSIPYELTNVAPSEVAVGQSLINTLMPVGAMTGSVLAGSLYSWVGSWHLALMICASASIVRGLVGLGLPETGPKAHVQSRS
ncbi:MAG: MFS transporter [Chloroflexi bacterium]|nr:MFS transporter [Chloroflexota bacterium]